MHYSDLLFFLGLLPCSVLLSFLDRSAEYKNLILIVTSVIFISWAVPMKVCLIFSAVIFLYLLGLAIGKTRENSKGIARVLLAASFLLNVGVFIVFGHNDLVESFEFLRLEYTVSTVAAAYVAVRGFSYCYDVYKGNCHAEKNIFCLLTYMVSYHLILAGPVVRYGDIEPAIRKRTVTGRDINDGLNLFIAGLGKVVLLAPVFSRLKYAGLGGSEITLAGCWLGMLAFFAEGYFLFTGTADMAVGLGRMNGFSYPKNYEDIGVNGLFKGLVRSYNTTLVDFYGEVSEDISGGRRLPGALCTIACGGLVALWYGIKLNYLLVGVCAGLIIALEKYLPGEPLFRLPIVIKGIYLFVLTYLLFGGLYFSSFGGYRKWLLALAGRGTAGLLSDAVKYTVLNNIFLIAAAFIIVCAPLKKALTALLKRYGEISPGAYGQAAVAKTIFRAALLLICAVTLAVKTLNLY